MRKLRRTLHLLGPAVGMALVLGAVLLADTLVVRLFLVIAGLLLTEAGLWRLADPLLPDERSFLALRAETDHFVALVRQLNSVAVALERGDVGASSFVLDEVHEEMHRSVDRMARFAGRKGLPPDGGAGPDPRSGPGQAGAGPPPSGPTVGS